MRWLIFFLLSATSTTLYGQLVNQPQAPQRAPQRPSTRPTPNPFFNSTPATKPTPVTKPTKPGASPVGFPDMPTQVVAIFTGPGYFDEALWNQAVAKETGSPSSTPQDARSNAPSPLTKEITVVTDPGNLVSTPASAPRRLNVPTPDIIPPNQNPPSPSISPSVAATGPDDTIRVQNVEKVAVPETSPNVNPGTGGQQDRRTSAVDPSPSPSPLQQLVPPTLPSNN